MFDFYSKPMSSPYLVLEGSALGRTTKKSTIFMEGMRRIRNCSLELSWDIAASHLSRFSWQMLISGYGEQFRRQTITVVLNRCDQMLAADASGSTHFWRSRAAIKSH